MNSMNRQNDRIPKEELPRSVGAQYATGDQWRNNSRKNKGMEPKQKQYPVADMTGNTSKVLRCKEILHVQGKRNPSKIGRCCEKASEGRHTETIITEN